MMGSGNVRDAHMASSNRFWRDTVHNHPVIVTTTAATAGVLLGGLFAVQLLDASQPVANNAAPPPAAAQAKVEKPSAETTGSAPTGERTASAECERQTWPYLSGDCLDEYRRTHRAARVVSTDKLDKQTVESIENPKAPTELATPAPWSPAVASTDLLAPATVAPIAPAPASVAIGTAGAEPTPASTAQSSPPSPPAPSQAAAKNEDKASVNHDEKAVAKSEERTAAKSEEKEKHTAKKAKRKPKSERRAPPRPDVDDDSYDGTMTAAYSDDGDDEPVATGRRERPRIVRRGLGRDYDVPDEDDGGRRRVIVIHRDRGGLFGNLFGGF
jgi:hypothetical protein